MNAFEYLQKVFYWGIWGLLDGKISNFIEKKNMLEIIKF
jgi:hypothetical protein